MSRTSYAKQILESWGIPVSDIPTSDEEEADFIASFGSSRVLIEEKTKLDDEDSLAQRKNILAKGEIHGVSISLARNNRLSGIIGKAASQLESSSDIEHDYRLIWFTGTGIHSEVQYEQFISTIYGTTQIVEMNKSHYVDCYFFRNSDFYRHSGIIDAAVAAHASGSEVKIKLFLNSLSSNYVAIKSSPLASFFGNAVVDPMELESRGGAYIADGDVDRDCPQAVLAYLEKKYQTSPLMNMDIGHHSATVLVPRQ